MLYLSLIQGQFNALHHIYPDLTPVDALAIELQLEYLSPVQWDALNQVAQGLQ